MASNKNETINHIDEEWITISKKEKSKKNRKEESVEKIETNNSLKTEPKVENKVEHKVENKVEHKVETKVENKVEPKVETKVENKVETKVENRVQRKTQMCKSISAGIQCKFGDRCNFAHSESEIFVQERIEKPSTPAVPKTKMCQSIVSGIECTYGNRCCFAHNLDQLQVRECNFGNGCRNKFCIFIHPSESKQDYEKRTRTNQRENIKYPKAPLLAPVQATRHPTKISLESICY
jgi:hypothetical protein